MDIRLYSKILWDWGVRCFGRDHMQDSKVRALRTVEEVMELAQALDVDRDKLHLLVDTVYDRPKGDPSQEFGGVMVCLMVLAHARGTNLSMCAEHEMLRVLSKSPEHFAKRNDEKIALGLT